VQLYLVEGLAFVKKKNYSEAASKFDQALFYDTLKVEAYLNIAAIYAFTANKQEAANFLNQLIARVPNCYVAYRELGNVYYDLGRYNEAKIAYESYHAVTDFSLEENERYAYILFFTKNYDLALEEVKNLSHNDPENYIFLRLISYMNFETGKFDKGLESFAKFFDKIPESKIILMDYEYYAKTLASSNMDSLAVITYLKAYDKDTTKLSYLDEAGKISTKQKKYAESIAYYSKSVSKKQNPIPLDYFQLGRSYYLFANSLKNGADSLKFDSLTFETNVRMADTMFTKVSLLQPNSYLGYIWRARTNSLLDPESNLGLAKPFYEQTLTQLLLNPSKYTKEIIEVYSYMGYYYYVIDNKEESKVNWAKILEIDPANEKALAAIKDLNAVLKK
jgi:tetratricopeptide (TPR) repeat protein